MRRPGSSWGFGALLKGLTSVVVSKVERTLFVHSPHQQFLSDPQPQVTSPTLYPLGHDCPVYIHNTKLAMAYDCPEPTALKGNVLVKLLSPSQRSAAHSSLWWAPLFLLPSSANSKKKKKTEQDKYY